VSIICGYVFILHAVSTIVQLFDGDELFTETDEEVDNSIAHGEKGVVAAGANSTTSADTGADLADDNLTGFDFATAKDFDAAAFAWASCTLGCRST